MKAIYTKCPNCGATMFVNADAQRATCEFCKTTVIIDDGTEKVRIKNPGQAGYEFEQGRLRAYDEYMSRPRAMRVAFDVEPVRKEDRTWLWALGWFLAFPIPLSILLMKSETLDKSLKAAVIATAWAVYLTLVAAYRAGAC